MVGKNVIVEFDPIPYAEKHRKAPRGRRYWRFGWNGKRFQSPLAMTLTEAKRWVIALLDRTEFGMHIVQVLP